MTALPCLTPRLLRGVSDVALRTRSGALVADPMFAGVLYLVQDRERLETWCAEHGVTLHPDRSARAYTLDGNGRRVPVAAVGNGHRAGA